MSRWNMTKNNLSNMVHNICSQDILYIFIYLLTDSLRQIIFIPILEVEKLRGRLCNLSKVTQ